MDPLAHGALEGNDAGILDFLRGDRVSLLAVARIGAGVDLASLVTTSAILTAVIAFAMQDTLGNVLAGLAIQLDNSVQVGDWVRVENLAGRVRDIRWRSTLLETRDWETVVIPNSMLMKSRVAILGRREGTPSQWRRILEFMVDPGVPPARVIAIARAWLGTPYHDQASLRGVGCDCLGLARGVWREVVGPEPVVFQVAAAPQALALDHREPEFLALDVALLALIEREPDRAEEALPREAICARR